MMPPNRFDYRLGGIVIPPAAFHLKRKADEQIRDFAAPGGPPPGVEFDRRQVLRFQGKLQIFRLHAPTYGVGRFMVATGWISFRICFSDFRATIAKSFVTMVFTVPAGSAARTAFRCFPIRSFAPS